MGVAEKIKWRFVGSVLAAVLLTSCACGIYSAFRKEQGRRSRFHAAGSLSAELVASVVGQAVDREQFGEVSGVMGAVLRDRWLASGCVTDEAGGPFTDGAGQPVGPPLPEEFRGLKARVLAAAATEVEEREGRLLVATPLRGNTPGFVFLEFADGSTTETYAESGGYVWFTLALLSVAFLVTIVFARRVTAPVSRAVRRTVEGVTQCAKKVFDAAGHLTRSSLEIAEGATEQASNLQETSASLQEMATMTRQNAENAGAADQVAGDAFVSAEHSREAVGRLSSAMSLIRQSSESMAKTLKTIDAIAFQTNLLALNAAVEAARAGDAGRGFAVVAEEVRNLAKRSAEAAKETSELIRESQKNVENGVSASAEMQTVLDQIAGGVQRFKQLVSEVSAASQEQAQGIEQITSAVTRIGALTQMNASKSQEATTVSESLFTEAKAMNDLVDDLGVSLDARRKTSAMGDAPAFAPPGGALEDSSVASTTAQLDAIHVARWPSGGWQPDEEGAGAAAANEAEPGRPTGGRRSPSAVLKPEQVIPLSDEELEDFRFATVPEGERN